MNDNWKIQFKSIYDDQKVKMELDGDTTLPDVIEAFQAFLEVTGYSIPGTIVIDPDGD